MKARGGLDARCPVRPRHSCSQQRLLTAGILVDLEGAVRFTPDAELLYPLQGRLSRARRITAKLTYHRCCTHKWMDAWPRPTTHDRSYMQASRCTHCSATVSQRQQLGAKLQLQATSHALMRWPTAWNDMDLHTTAVVILHLQPFCDGLAET